MSNMSISFPGGEEMFVRSVNAFRDQIHDDRLKRQVRAFISQEANHARVHEAMNRGLAQIGLDGAQMTANFRRLIEKEWAKRTPLENLADTCALEHLTAILSEFLLTTPEYNKQFFEPFRTLWLWHSIEELEHKSVAFDVFTEVSADYELRIRSMARVTFLFLAKQSLMNLGAIISSGQIRRPLYLASKLWQCFGPRGYFTRMIPKYLRYYRRDFHPWETDSQPLIDRFEIELNFAAALDAKQ